MTSTKAPALYEVVLRRANGRLVKASTRRSKYAAKRLAATWEDTHDETYYVEINRLASPATMR